VLVLQRVALHDRLARCALVSRLWASAAAAATASIKFSVDRDAIGQNLQPSMLRWLWKHGNAVTSINAVQPDFDPHYFGAHVELPCTMLTNLRSLSLNGMLVELVEGHGSTLSTASKPGKRRNTKNKGARHVASGIMPDSSAPGGPASKGNTSSAEKATGAITKPVPAPTSDTSAIAKQSGRMGLAASTSNPTPQAVLPRLQDLQLVNCAVTGLQLLPRIKGITTLVLNNLELLPGPNFCSIFEETLRNLVGLSELHFSYSSCNRPALSCNTLDAVTSLQRLQRLELMVSGKVDLGFLGRLPTSLTALQLQAEGKQVDFQDVLDLYDASLESYRLTGLQDLALRRIIINTSTLAALSSTLRSLQLEAVVGTPETDAPLLFGFLQQLSCLQHLALAGNFWDEYEGPPIVPWLLQSLSALTAASGLTSLHLYNPHEEPPLPEGALSYILPAGKQLPSLKVLRISCNPRSDSCETDDGDCWCVDGHDINRIADCCPNLEQITLHSVVTLDLDRGCLSKLPSSLHTLSLEGAAFDKGAAQSVAKLIGLRCLHWCDNLIKDKELQELTALTRLTELHVARCGAHGCLHGSWAVSGHSGRVPGLDQGCCWSKPQRCGPDASRLYQ
jgi:hypothetical protein